MQGENVLISRVNMGNTKFMTQKGSRLPTVSALLPLASYLKKGHHMALYLYILAMTIPSVKNDFLQKYGM